MCRTLLFMSSASTRRWAWFVPLLSLLARSASSCALYSFICCSSASACDQRSVKPSHVRKFSCCMLYTVSAEDAPRTHELGCVTGSCSPVSRHEPSMRRRQRSARCCRRHMPKVRQLSYHGLFAHEVLLLLLLPFIPGQPLCSEGCNTSSMPFLRMEAGVHPKFSCDAAAVSNGVGKVDEKYRSIEYIGLITKK